MCARIMSKDNVTKTLSDISNNNPKVFVEALEHVEVFIEKILMLTKNNPEQLRALFNHSKKGIQYKTDQNFYFLWAILFKTSVEDFKIIGRKNLREYLVFFLLFKKHLLIIQQKNF